MISGLPLARRKRYAMDFRGTHATHYRSNISRTTHGLPMNALSLEHKSCCDRHGLTHGLTTHHDLESLSTVTNFSNRKSSQVEEKGISTQQSSSIQNNSQHINSNHPTTISTPSLQPPLNQPLPPPPKPPTQILQNAVHHPRHRRFRSSHLRRSCQARTHRPLPSHRHSPVLPSRRRRRSRPQLRGSYVHPKIPIILQPILSLTHTSTAEPDLTTVADFEASCAASGTTAMCCTVPVVCFLFTA
jgi:hypothetical protein